MIHCGPTKISAKVNISFIMKQKCVFKYHILLEHAAKWGFGPINLFLFLSNSWRPPVLWFKAHTDHFIFRPQVTNH